LFKDNFSVQPYDLFGIEKSIQPKWNNL
jgi:hypothetical protein